jgi:hypothetical protein
MSWDTLMVESLHSLRNSVYRGTCRELEGLSLLQTLTAASGADRDHSSLDISVPFPQTLHPGPIRHAYHVPFLASRVSNAWTDLDGRRKGEVPKLPDCIPADHCYLQR